MKRRSERSAVSSGVGTTPDTERVIFFRPTNTSTFQPASVMASGKRKRDNARYFAGESNGIVRTAVLERKKKEFYRNARVIQQFKRVRKREEKVLSALKAGGGSSDATRQQKKRKKNTKGNAAGDADAKRLSRYEAYFKDGQSEDRFTSSQSSGRGKEGRPPSNGKGDHGGRMAFKSQKQRRKEKALESENGVPSPDSKKSRNKKKRRKDWADSGPADLRIHKPDPFHKEKQAKKCVRSPADSICLSIYTHQSK